MHDAQVDGPAPGERASRTSRIFEESTITSAPVDLARSPAYSRARIATYRTTSASSPGAGASASSVAATTVGPAASRSALYLVHVEAGPIRRTPRRPPLARPRTSRTARRIRTSRSSTTPRCQMSRSSPAENTPGTWPSIRSSSVLPLRPHPAMYSTADRAGDGIQQRATRSAERSTAASASREPGSIRWLAGSATASRERRGQQRAQLARPPRGDLAGPRGSGRRSGADGRRRAHRVRRSRASTIGIRPAARTAAIVPGPPWHTTAAGRREELARAPRRRSIGTALGVDRAAGDVPYCTTTRARARRPTRRPSRRDVRTGGGPCRPSATTSGARGVDPIGRLEEGADQSTREGTAPLLLPLHAEQVGERVARAGRSACG